MQKLNKSSLSQEIANRLDKIISDLLKIDDISPEELVKLYDKKIMKLDDLTDGDATIKEKFACRIAEQKFRMMVLRNFDFQHIERAYNDIYSAGNSVDNFNFRLAIIFAEQCYFNNQLDRAISIIEEICKDIQNRLTKKESSEYRSIYRLAKKKLEEFR